MTICCSFVPANWPNIACVMEEGGWIVKAYINMDDVVAMIVDSSPRAKIWYMLKSCAVYK